MGPQNVFKVASCNTYPVLRDEYKFVASLKTFLVYNVLMILVHVITALFSIIFASMTFLYPTDRKLYINYGLISGTVLTGVVLMLQQPTHMLSICMTGLVYLGCMSVALFAIRLRMAFAKNRIK